MKNRLCFYQSYYYRIWIQSLLVLWLVLVLAVLYDMTNFSSTQFLQFLSTQSQSQSSDLSKKRRKNKLNE